MTTWAWVDKASQQIMSYGRTPNDPPDDTIALIELSDEHTHLLEEPGRKTLNEDGTITVTPPDPLPPPPPSQAEQVDTLVANGKAAIAAANITSPEAQALAQIFAGALDGLGAIYGTATGEQS